MPNFVENIRDALPNYLNHIKSLHSEESKKVYCLNFLQKVFDIKPEDLDFEVHTKSQIFNVSGRIDTLFENILFEFKKNVNNVGMVNDGKTELKKCRKLAYIRFYFRFGFIIRILTNLKSVFQFSNSLSNGLQLFGNYFKTPVTIKGNHSPQRLADGTPRHLLFKKMTKMTGEN